MLVKAAIQHIHRIHSHHLQRQLDASVHKQMYSLAGACQSMLAQMDDVRIFHMDPKLGKPTTDLSVVDSIIDHKDKYSDQQSSFRNNTSYSNEEGVTGFNDYNNIFLANSMSNTKTVDLTEHTTLSREELENNYEDLDESEVSDESDIMHIGGYKLSSVGDGAFTADKLGSLSNELAALMAKTEDQ